MNGSRSLKDTYFHAGWAILVITLFTIAIATDSPTGADAHLHIVKTDRGSFISGVGGPLRLCAHFIWKPADKAITRSDYTAIILDDLWGRGSGRYRFGFVIGWVLLSTGMQSIGVLAAVIRAVSEGRLPEVQSRQHSAQVSQEQLELDFRSDASTGRWAGWPGTAPPTDSSEAPACGGAVASHSDDQSSVSPDTDLSHIVTAEFECRDNESRESEV